MVGVNLSLETSRSDDYLIGVIHDLVQELNRTGDLNARTTSSVSPSSRGQWLDPATLIAVSFLSGGAAAALLNCVRAFIQRDRELKVTLQSSDGRKVVVDSKNLSPGDFTQLLEIVHSMSTSEESI